MSRTKNNKFKDNTTGSPSTKIALEIISAQSKQNKQKEPLLHVGQALIQMPVKCSHIKRV